MRSALGQAYLEDAMADTDLIEEGLRLVGDSTDRDIVFEVARSLVATADPETVEAMARASLADSIRGRIRSATLAAELAAERAAGQVDDDDDDEDDDLYRRPPEKVGVSQRHGTWNARGKARNGCTCDECSRTMVAYRQYEESAEQTRERHYARMREINEKYTAELRIEWTQELLASTIALPDGTRTTWSAATIEDHGARVEMFTANAVANAEGAARHLKAIEAIKAAGVTCLGELAETT